MIIHISLITKVSLSISQQGRKKMKNIVMILGFMVLIQCPGLTAVIHVPGDQPTIQSGIDATVAGDTVLVAAGLYYGVGNRDISYAGKAITVISENGPETCIIDCQDEGRGFYFHGSEESNSILCGFTITNGVGDPGGAIHCSYSSPTLQNCIITGNRSSWRGGGISLFSSSSILSNCIITDNIVYIDDPGASDDAFGGGIYAIGSFPVFINCSILNNTAEQWLYGEPLGVGGGVFAGSTLLFNCLIAGNNANESCGGGLLTDGCLLINCTIVNNDGGERAGGLSCDDTTALRNCIVWDNLPGSIFGSPNVIYSDVQGGYSGEGNIDSDPLFAPGQSGEFFLGQIAAGQDQDSPCLDAGNTPASTTCFDTPDGERCLDAYTTRTDSVTDAGMVDMGFHYPVPAPVCEDLGIAITMNSNHFVPGETVSVSLVTCNPESETIESARVYLVLDITGIFFFWPTWSTTADFNFQDISTGFMEEEILSFTWPETGTTGNAAFIAAMTNEDFSEPLGTWDIGAFTWE